MHFDLLHTPVLSVCPRDVSFSPIGPMLGPTIVLFRCFTHLMEDFLPNLDGTYPSLIPCIF
jgi:hypothetical protein